MTNQASDSASPDPSSNSSKTSHNALDGTQQLKSIVASSLPIILPAPVTQTATGRTEPSIVSFTNQPQIRPSANHNIPLPMPLLPPMPLSKPEGVTFDSQSKLTQTHPAFKNRKLRSGKWIRQEEEYAEDLIKLFEKGWLRDCENGCTLRAYLSSKLHCAPMRISKKYAGKGIGKLLYLSRMGSYDEGPTDEVRKLEAKIKQKERAFYDAAFREIPRPLGELLLTPPILPPLRGIHHTQLASLPTGIPAVSMPFLASSTNVPLMNMPVSVTAIPPAGMGFAATQPPSSVHAQTQLLQESYLNALRQTSTCEPVPNMAPVPANNMLNSAQHPAANMHSQQLTPLLPGQAPLSGSKFQAPAAVPRTHEITAQFATTEDATVPDLLAGFDKLVSDSRPTHQLQDPNTLQCSPPLTSRSFDDFHRFLGMDLGQLEPLDTSQPAAAVPHGNAALFSAESYAIFAAESAQAASQHAAYLPIGTVPELKLNATDRKMSFDVENTMKLVSDTIGLKRDRSNEESGLDATTHDYHSPTRGSTQDHMTENFQIQTYRASSHGMTSIERLYGAFNGAVVSGSEPSFPSSGNESGSEFTSGGDSGDVTGSDSADSSDDMSSEGSDSHSHHPPSKRAKSIDSNGQTISNMDSVL